MKTEKAFVGPSQAVIFMLPPSKGVLAFAATVLAALIGAAALLMNGYWERKTPPPSVTQPASSTPSPQPAALPTSSPSDQRHRVAIPSPDRARNSNRRPDMSPRPLPVPAQTTGPGNCTAEDYRLRNCKPISPLVINSNRGGNYVFPKTS